LEVLSKYPVVAAEVAGIPEIGRDADNIGEGRPLFRENSTNRLDRSPRLLLDCSRDHVAVGILRNLARNENEVARAYRGMKRQVRVLLSDWVHILSVAARVVHRTDLIRMPWFQ